MSWHLQTVEEKLTYEEFQARCQAISDASKYDKGARVFFRETGKHGWTSVDDILEGKPGGRPGPHWCDASTHRSQWLTGTYDFNTGIAKLFIPK